MYNSCVCLPGNGQYAYIEASTPRRANDTARLESVVLGSTPGTCVSFYYHMYGTDIHTLTLYSRAQGTKVRTLLYKQLSIHFILLLSKFYYRKISSFQFVVYMSFPVVRKLCEIQTYTLELV